MSNTASHPGHRPAIAAIHHQHLRHNYTLLQQRCKSAAIMAVVKANAYGHGMQEVAATLYQAGCNSFAVTDAHEGCILRSSLETQQAKASITLLSGLFCDDDAKLAKHNALTPVITETQHILWLQRVDFHGSVWIKIDSGMNRLGAIDPANLIKRCQQANINISGFMSHLACADEANHPMNAQQVETFTRICEPIDSHLPRSLLNSAGIVAMPEHSMSVIRPGLALYGIEPIPSQPIGLKPVMSLYGNIIQLRDLPVGATLSYGASFSIDRPMRIATISLGYADGLPRGLSNIGNAYSNTNLCPIVGRICMDYSLIDVSQIDVSQIDVSHRHAAIRDKVEFWGEHILLHDVACQLNTISYTLLTGVGNRVQRLHYKDIP